MHAIVQCPHPFILWYIFHFKGHNVTVSSLRRDGNGIVMNRPHRNTVVFMQTPAHT